MKGIIFDLDGVIISTDKLHYKAWKKIADKFNSKDYLIVSYEMETQHSGEAECYQVTMVIKSKRNNDEWHLLSLIQEFPDVTVQRIE